MKINAWIQIGCERREVTFDVTATEIEEVGTDGPEVYIEEAPLRPYDLRHTCATLLLAGGEHPKVVAERLGHSSTVMTMDVYSHVLPDMQEAAAEKLERLLFVP